MAPGNRSAAVPAPTFISLALLLSAGCVDTDPGDTVRRHLKLLDRRQFEEFYDMHASESLPDRQGFIDSLEDANPEGAGITGIEIVEDAIEGDTASVKVMYVPQRPALPDDEVTAAVEPGRAGGGRWRIVGDYSCPVPVCEPRSVQLLQGVRMNV